ncbi:hypothetical protein [Streptomyces sp. NBC_00658]|uniref:hypothetical protein n=1 Tax=Streptomyces sp. NBC_00658 TaxID=2975800 RepID=UPI0032490640
MTLPETLSAAGIGVFGSAMPILASSWSTSAVTSERDGLALSVPGTWSAPLAGHIRTAEEAASRGGVFLRRPDGTAVPSSASVVSLYPQQYLRLARLYALLFEDAAGARPGRALGLPARPVPAHLVLENGGVPPGAADPGDPLVGGVLSFHDSHGQPLDAVAVAAAFLALQRAHQPLQQRGIGEAFDQNPPLAALVADLAASPSVRVRLVDGSGVPFNGGDLTGLTAVDPSSGLFSVPGLAATVGKAAVGPGFSAESARTRLIGLATTGRLADAVTFPALPSNTTLVRDFFTLRVIDLSPYLLGTPPASWQGARIEPAPALRRDEPVTLLPDGNDLLGAATTALTGATAESLAVAPLIDGTFAAPPAPGAPARWPAFPPLAGAAAPAGAIPVVPTVSATAAILDDGAPATTDVDVVLTLGGLPAGAAVRAYHRVFSASAVESRGDGAGGIADTSGTAVLRLRDPLGLRRPGQATPDPMPGTPVLHVDVVVVKRTGEARIFGDVSVAISGTAAAPPAAVNLFAGATRRGVCNAGVLGLGILPPPPAGTSLVASALALLGETTPRDAPRLPGMARRDLLVAGLASATGGNWRSVLGAGRLAPELHNAAARIGAPGGAGGRETQAVGVATTGGRLAYDIARAALRRTTSVYARLAPLVGEAWNEPSASSNGTFAGAVLQTVAAVCETPELSLLRALGIVDPDDAAFPRDFDSLVDTAQGWLTGLVAQLPAGLPASVSTRLNELVGDLQDLKDDAPADESVKERIFNELLREIAASGWGRRDAQWALQGALARAERFVYVETPGLGPTAAAGSSDAYAADLFAVLSARLVANPALHVAICCPEQPDFPFGFNPFTDYELASRRSALLGLPTASAADPFRSRVLAFHPIGFPGRPSRLESTVVIVDDVWMLIGSSALRRRGLTFDGGSDLVVTDADLVEGRSPAIAEFRRALQADRLGVATPPPAGPALPSSSFLRLADGAEAFHEIREVLRGGGLGRISRLAPPDPPGRPTAAGPADVVDPDSETVDLPRLLAALALAGSASA